ncbi:MAG: LysM peptidoglycan-binding domain-containing protein [Candidatus Korobacteraceae bacterium]
MPKLVMRGAVAILCGLLAISRAEGQSLGDVARQEKQRRSQLVHRAPVLSNEDLSRTVILSKEYREQLAARRREQEALASVEINPGNSLRTEHVDFIEQVLALKLSRLSLHSNFVSKPLMHPGEQRNAAIVRSGRQHPVVRRSRTERNPVSKVSVKKAAKQLPLMRVETSLLQPSGLRTIRVRRGDSLWQLAKRHLGSGRHWQALWRANAHIANPSYIKAGDVIVLPGESPTFAQAE